MNERIVPLIDFGPSEIKTPPIFLDPALDNAFYLYGCIINLFGGSLTSVVFERMRGLNLACYQAVDILKKRAPHSFDALFGFSSTLNSTSVQQEGQFMLGIKPHFLDLPLDATIVVDPACYLFGFPFHNIPVVMGLGLNHGCKFIEQALSQIYSDQLKKPVGLELVKTCE